MAEHSHIEWTDATWNPITGCSIVSPGCTHCYAMGLAGTRLRQHPSRAGLTREVNGHHVWTGEVRFNKQWLTQPLTWRRPRMVFVCAHGDLFHESVPDEWIDRVFAVMALSPQHTFQVLTKRSARMRDYMAGDPTTRWLDSDVWKADGPWWKEYRNEFRRAVDNLICGAHFLSNVWLGVSAERQQEADARIPDLLGTPAAVRFVSAEPLLGPIDFTRLDVPNYGYLNALTEGYFADGRPPRRRLSWIIIGGESGSSARPMHPDWARSIRDQCTAAGVAFFFKQWGAWAPQRSHPVSHEAGTLTRMTTISSTLRRDVGAISYLAGCGDGRPSIPMRNVGKASAGRILDGRTWDEMPAGHAP